MVGQEEVGSRLWSELALGMWVLQAEGGLKVDRGGSCQGDMVDADGLTDGLN